MYKPCYKYKCKSCGTVWVMDKTYNHVLTCPACGVKCDKIKKGE